ncbi:pentatricopeptide repeat-containing protein At3g24000, mitochondrial-like isoform X2 [Aristolochia californica]
MPHRDVVSWTSLIVGYAKNELFVQSLGLLQSMMVSGTVPNKFTFSGALTACSGLQGLRQCKQIHAKVIVYAGFSEDNVLQNSLLNTYCQCRVLDCARKLFNLMPRKSNIAWNELICGYLREGQGEEALTLFASMVSEGEKPDDFSYAICANACAEFASIRQGVQIHACVVKSGFESDIVTANSLIDMYAKVGCVDSAKLIFYMIPYRDTKLCTAMISALGKCGLAEDCFTVFNQMQEWNVKPDEITYVAILSACSHRGLQEQGWNYFRRMIVEDLIPAKQEHYACIVDLLSRSGSLTQALEFIKEMPLEPNAAVWTAFLNACHLYGHIEFAQIAARHLLELTPENHGNHVVLSNMHAAGSDWEWTETIREKMRSTNIKKQPGCSWIEVNNGVRVFLTADRSHPEMSELLRTLNGLVVCFTQDEEPFHHWY